MCGDGQTIDKILKVFPHRSIRAIRHKRKELNLTIIRRNQWLKKEDDVLRQLCALGYSIKRLQRVFLRRSADAIAWRKIILNIPRRKRNKIRKEAPKNPIHAAILARINVANERLRRGAA